MNEEVQGRGFICAAVRSTQQNALNDIEQLELIRMHVRHCCSFLGCCSSFQRFIV